MDGGVATVVEGAARALAAVGEEVVVHVRAAAGAPTRGQPWQVVPMSGRSWGSWQAVWAAASVLPRLRRGDRVLCATWPLAVHLLGPARRLGVPVGVLFHGSDLTRPPPIRGREAVEAEATALLPASAFLGGLLTRPWERLPMPVDLVEEPAGPRDALLAVARLGPLKGVDRVLRLGARSGRRVVVVGEGPERPALEALARELGVQARFTGRLRREDIPWGEAAAVCLLSRADTDGSGAEGFGLVLVEGAARGVPGLGSPVGGLPEAADLVLADPDHDPLPPLPDAATVRARVAAAHGTGRLVEVLRRSVGDGAVPT